MLPHEAVLSIVHRLNEASNASKECIRSVAENLRRHRFELCLQALENSDYGPCWLMVRLFPYSCIDNSSPDIVAMLESGLKSNSSEAKYALFLFKKIVFDTESGRPKCGYGTINSKWDRYFCCMEAIQNQSLHFLLPQLFMLEDLICTTDIPSNWWIVILELAVNNQWLAQVKAKTLQFVCQKAIPGSVLLNLIRSNHQFCCVSLINALDHVALYQVPGKGSFISPFGELVSKFIHVLASSDISIFKGIIAALPRIKAAVAAIFILQGLSSISVKGYFDTTDLGSLARLFDAQMTSTVYDTDRKRKVVSIFSTQIIINCGDSKNIEFINLACYLKVSQNNQTSRLIGNWFNAETDNYLADSVLLHYKSLVKNRKCECCTYNRDATEISGSLSSISAHLLKGKGNSFQEYKPILDWIDSELLNLDQNTDTMILQIVHDILQTLLSAEEKEIRLAEYLSVSFFQSIMSHCFKMLDVRQDEYSRIDFYVELITYCTELNPACILPAQNQSCLISKHETPVEIYRKFKIFTLRSKAFSASSIIQSNGAENDDLLLVAKCEYLLKLDLSTLSDLGYLFEALSKILPTTTKRTAVPVITVMISILDTKRIDVQPSIEEVLDCIFALINEFWKSSQRWLSFFTACSKLCFHSEVLRIGGRLDRIWDRFLQMSLCRAGILNIGSEIVYQFFKLNPEKKIQHVNIILDMLLHAEYSEGDKLKSSHDSVIAIKCETKAGQDLWDMRNTAQWSFDDDYLIRVRSFELMLSLQTGRKQDIEFANLLLKRIFAIGSKYKARYPNSKEQRMCLRLWTAVHVLIPFIAEENSKNVYASAISVLENEVLGELRSYIELALARLIKANSGLIDLCLAYLTDIDIKPNNILSMLKIAVLATIPGETVYKTMLAVVPWTSSTHAQVRAMAQYALLTFRERLKSTSLYAVIEKDLTLSTLINFISKSADCQKNLEKVRSVYFFNGFNLERDMNIEFLFRGIQTVLGVGHEEKISCVVFMKMNSNGFNIPTGFNQRHQMESASEMDEMSMNLLEIEDRKVDFNVPVQRKILPFEALIQAEMDLSEQKRVETPRHSVVMVASLLTKPANFGGLCRTCEIFGAEMLVVPNLKVKFDALFIATTVTAEQWMPLQQVTVAELPEYLKSKKHDGYRIVGVEQTSGSVKLHQYSFRPKTVIVLGNEKDGIDADLMYLMDDVVEIVQFGVIRSLNAHVSGSLVLWEYIKQVQT